MRLPFGGYPKVIHVTMSDLPLASEIIMVEEEMLIEYMTDDWKLLNLQRNYQEDNKYKGTPTLLMMQ